MLHMHDMTILEQFMGVCSPIFFWSGRLTKHWAEVFAYNDEEHLDKTNTKQKNIYTSWFPSGKFAITQPILDHLSEKCCPAFNSFIYVIDCPLWGWNVWAYISGCISNICLSMARWDTVSVYFDPTRLIGQSREGGWDASYPPWSRVTPSHSKE